MTDAVPCFARAAPAAVERSRLAVPRAHDPRALRRAGSRLEPYDKQYRVRMHDGRVRWVLSSARPRAELDGSIVWHGYWADITCRRELEEQLVAEKERAERAYILAKLREHDWNVSETARAVDMPRSNLYKKIERYNLVREDA